MPEQTTKKKLKEAMFRQIRHYEGMAISSILERRSFLITLFTITIALLGGIFTAGFKMNIQTLIRPESQICLFVISINIFLIPFYLWYAMTEEVSHIRERYNLLLKVYNNNMEVSEEDKKEFDRLFNKPNKKPKYSIDYLFHIIVWVFLVGMFFLLYLNWSYFTEKLTNSG